MALLVQPLANPGTVTGVSNLPKQPVISNVVPATPKAQITSIGTATDQRPYTAPILTDEEKTKMVNVLSKARQQYPNADDEILHRFIQDNQTTHPDIVKKIQPLMSNARTDRNNNPIAAAVGGSGKNEFTDALDQSGIKWEQGDMFPHDPNMKTIKIQGDGTEGARAILSNSSAIQNWYLNHTGKDVLSQYGVKNNQDFQKLDPQSQNAIIAGIHKNENGSGDNPQQFSSKEILDSIIRDNTVQAQSNETSNTPQDQPQDRSGNFFQRVGQDFQGRQDQLQKDLELQKQGKEGPVAGLLQTIGAGAGGLSDLVGEGITSTFRTAAPDNVQQGVKMWGNALENTVSNPNVQKTLAPIGKAVNDFEGKHPVGVANTKAIGNIANVALMFMGGNEDKQAIEKATQSYNDALGATKSGIQTGSKVLARSGEAPGEFLAHAGLPPETAEVNGRRIFTTGPESKTYQAIEQRADALTNLRDEAIDKAGQTVPSSVDGLRQAALDKAKSQFIGKEQQQVIDHINSEFDAFQSQPNANQNTLPNINVLKKYFQGNAGYDATRPSTITEANRMLANLAKTQVEQDAEKAGIPGVDKLNKFIQQHLDLLDDGNKKGILSKLNGQVVRGGLIGTRVKEGLGGAVGLAASHALGGGLLGDLAGTAAGATSGNLISRFMQSLAAGGSKASAVLGRMSTENPEIVKQFLEYLGQSGDIATKVKPIGNIGTIRSAGLLENLFKKNQQSKTQEK